MEGGHRVYHFQTPSQLLCDATTPYGSRLKHWDLCYRDKHMAKLSKETKQRLQQLFQCSQFVIRWGFIPTVLYLVWWPTQFYEQITFFVTRKVCKGPHQSTPRGLNTVVPEGGFKRGADPGMPEPTLLSSLFHSTKKSWIELRMLCAIIFLWYESRLPGSSSSCSSWLPPRKRRFQFSHGEPAGVLLVDVFQENRVRRQILSQLLEASLLEGHSRRRQTSTICAKVSVILKGSVGHGFVWTSSSPSPELSSGGRSVTAPSRGAPGTQRGRAAASIRAASSRRSEPRVNE
ncbi:hypothetical protein CCH79_00008491 [Gambusia affinis]|uniref:Mitochondrial import receptor subunit TOM7 homolog n=1 Tax=Gambusia affinis TaxID=33528 RepID=A0A315UVM2_GAMAF|nr:hypothetical protein CCH79_00008491 [Gambusia affinis]